MNAGQADDVASEIQSAAAAVVANNINPAAAAIVTVPVRFLLLLARPILLPASFSVRVESESSVVGAAAAVLDGMGAVGSHGVRGGSGGLQIGWLCWLQSSHDVSGIIVRKLAGSSGNVADSLRKVAEMVVKIQTSDDAKERMKKRVTEITGRIVDVMVERRNTKA